MSLDFDAAISRLSGGDLKTRRRVIRSGISRVNARLACGRLNPVLRSHVFQPATTVNDQIFTGHVARQV